MRNITDANSEMTLTELLRETYHATENMRMDGSVTGGGEIKK